MDHSVVLLISKNSGVNNKAKTGEIENVISEAWAIATVAAVPFVGDGRLLKSGAFGIGSLLHWILGKTNLDDLKGGGSTADPSFLSLAHTLHSCPLSPCSNEEGSAFINNTMPVPEMSSNFMTRSVVDWSVPAAHIKAPWVSTNVAMIFCIL